MDSKDQPSKDGAQAQTGPERLWSQALLAMSSAGEEAGRVAQRLAERAGLNPEDIRAHLREFTERLASQRREFERSVEEAAKKALWLRIPRREQLQELNTRLEALEARATALAERR